MKSKFGRIDKLSISFIVAMVLGVISSYMNLGMLSVFFSVIMPLLFVLNLLIAIYCLFKRKYVYSVGVFIFLLCYNFFFQFSKVTELENNDAISILTYNVRAFQQPIADNPNKNAATEIVKFIDSVASDIVVFQESSYKEGREITEYPYHFLGYREHVEKSLLTIYSKYPIINKGYIDFPNSKNNAIYADIKIKEDTIRIYNAHLQSFVVAPHILANKYNDYSYWKGLNTKIKKQIEQAKLIKNHANKSMKKVIICGDFNATPYSQTYRILKKGLNDSYLSHGFGFGKTYSLFHYPLRLDYFLNSDEISVLNHFNYDLNLSDHEPIVMKFTIK